MNDQRKRRRKRGKKKRTEARRCAGRCGDFSTKMFWTFFLVCGAGTFLGAMAAILWKRRKPPPASAEPSKHEAQRYFLLNETGNVLISTSLSPSGRLPDTTLDLFSEALAHLATVFYAVAGAKDPLTGEPFSLYNYGALKRVMDAHPVFIRMSSDSPGSPRNDVREGPLLLFGGALQESIDLAPRESPTWLDDRVKLSRDAMGIDDSPQNLQKLRALHSRMRAEAKRLEARPMLMGAIGLTKESIPSKPSRWPRPDDVEVGFVTLYCECLMGVSLVSVRLAHSHWRAYLSDPTTMEQDTYLFVSPSQLKKVSADINNLPRMNIGA